MRKMTAEELAIAERSHGLQEPSIKSDFGWLLNWYTYMCDEDDAREYLSTYFKSQNREEQIKVLDRVPDSWVPRTAAWLARLYSRGYALTPRNLHNLEEGLRKAFSHAAEQTVAQALVDENNRKRDRSVQDYITEKASEVYGEVEGLIDDGVVSPKWSLYRYLKGKEISAVVAKRLIEKFRRLELYYIEILTTKDPQVKEGYRHLTKQQLVDLGLLYQHLRIDSEKFAASEKAPRAPRKKKAPTIEKILKEFVYLKESNEFKVASINPEKIIGATELWTFQPKYKVLTVYRAQSVDGLKINRTKIVEFNVLDSMSKSIGRRTEEQLQTVLTGGKVALKKLMESINAKKLQMPTRITKETLLLRVL